MDNAPAKLTNMAIICKLMCNYSRYNLLQVMNDSIDRKSRNYFVSLILTIKPCPITIINRWRLLLLFNVSHDHSIIH